MKPKRTILCVDDNETNPFNTGRSCWKRGGYRGRELFPRRRRRRAIQSQGGIDLVITDMAMPGLDGPQFESPPSKTSRRKPPAILISSKVRNLRSRIASRRISRQGHVQTRADLLERIRLLLVRKRGPKRMQQRASAARGKSAQPEIKIFSRSRAFAFLMRTMQQDF